MKISALASGRMGGRSGMFDRRWGGGGAANGGTGSGRAAGGVGAFDCIGPSDVLADGLAAAGGSATWTTGRVDGAGFTATGFGGLGGFLAERTGGVFAR